ncbi:unnamed protein product [Protopolystoma xenopodis]|uniref:Uncharacterized protein n=1 Tax=Protopolystoma xenopodis TaxID=117903 RepID=A0A3S5FC21_9PLAT|nr:unnamed protein product [Protopolystoma xenopodis]
MEMIDESRTEASSSTEASLVLARWLLLANWYCFWPAAMQVYLRDLLGCRASKHEVLPYTSFS